MKTITITVVLAVMAVMAGCAFAPPYSYRPGAAVYTNIGAGVYTNAWGGGFYGIPDYPYYGIPGYSYGYPYGWGPRWIPGHQRQVCETSPPGPGCYWKWEAGHYE